MFEFVNEKDWEQFERAFPTASLFLQVKVGLRTIETLEYIAKISKLTKEQEVRLASLKDAGRLIGHPGGPSGEFWVCLLNDKKEDRDFYWMPSASTCESDCMAKFRDFSDRDPNWVSKNQLVKVVHIFVEQVADDLDHRARDWFFTG
jgi:hypothetical protein